MPDNEQNTPNEQQPTPPVPETGEGGQDWESLPGWAREERESLQARLSEVNNESAARRHQLKEYEERIARLEADRQERMTVEEKLKEAQAMADSLRQFEERAKSLEDRIKASNQQRIEAIPEQQRSLVPVDELSAEKLATWLDKNEALLRKPVAPQLDGGAGGSGGTPNVMVTDADRRAAAAAQAAGHNISAEQIAQRRASKS